MIFLSSNHWSADMQTADALAYLSVAENIETRALAGQFHDEFHEYAELVWSVSWVDTEASNVDVEYMSWVRDWIENNTPIRWRDGKPVIDEEGDEPDEF